MKAYATTIYSVESSYDCLSMTHPVDGVKALPDDRLHIVGSVLHVDPVQQCDVETRQVAALWSLLAQERSQAATVAQLLLLARRFLRARRRWLLPLRIGCAQHRVAGFFLLRLIRILSRGGAGLLDALSVVVSCQALQQRYPGHHRHCRSQPAHVKQLLHTCVLIGKGKFTSVLITVLISLMRRSERRTYLLSLTLISSKLCW